MSKQPRAYLNATFVARNPVGPFNREGWSWGKERQMPLAGLLIGICTKFINFYLQAMNPTTEETNVQLRKFAEVAATWQITEGRTP